MTQRRGMDAAPSGRRNGEADADAVNRLLADAAAPDDIAPEPSALPTERPKPERFPLVSSAALDSEDYTPRPIITEALFAGVPAIAGAPFKTCKSLIGIDGHISIATGLPWLGAFTVPTPMSSLYFVGEGGPCVTQDYGRRIAKSKGITLSDATQAHWCFSMPRFEDMGDLCALEKVFDATAAEVAWFDNLMLGLSGNDAGNVYKMGGILGNVIRICAERNVTPVFIHHFKRTRSTADPFAPGELADLTQAGAAEIAGQWWLLTRRRPYDPEHPGSHNLWLSIGGRVGHSSLHALDIQEGSRADQGGRRWEVEILSASDARESEHNQARATKDQHRSEKAAAELETDRREIVGTVVRLQAPETKNQLREQFPFGHRRFDRAFASLTSDGTLQQVSIEKANGQTYTGWRVRNESE
jgi:hypothetical protein